MSHRTLLLTLLVLLILPACPAAHRDSPDLILPLKRVRLYETGVGYFERSGELSRGERTALPVPAGHMDDALKTLTVVSQGHKLSIAGLSFDSSLSRGMARALAGLPLKGEQPVELLTLLRGLKGHELEIRTDGSTVRGRPLEVLAAEKPPEESKTDQQRPELKGARLLLMTADGGVRRIAVDGIEWVRPVNPELKARLSSAMQALSRRGRARRMLRLLTASRGPVTLGYVAEVPLWRTTYRLVLPQGTTAGATARATLQGWVLIHNDADEDWSQVQVELVSGRPDSFLFPLAVPRYMRRKLVHPETALPTVPQLMNTTADELWGDQLGDDSIGVGGLGTVGHGGGGGGGVGYGRGYGRVSGRSDVGGSSELTVGDLARFAKASGQEQGVLFSYRMPKALSIRAHGSALIPFLQSQLQARRITLMRSLTSAARSAILLTNSTRQTLPAGTIAFFGGGGFNGESFLERTKPGERRFLEHGTDLDVELTQKPRRDDEVRSPKEQVKKLTYAKRRLRVHFLRHKRLPLELRNRSTQARQLYLQLNLVRNATIKGADRLDYDRRASRAIAIFDLAPGSTVQRELTLVEGLSRRVRLSRITVKRLQQLAGESELPAAQRDVVKRCVDLRRKLEATDKELSQLADQISTSKSEITRLRKHLKAAGGKGAAVELLVKRILGVEDRLSGLQKRQTSLGERRKQELDAMDAELKPLGETAKKVKAG